MYDLGSRLKSIRLKRGLTQKELAAKIRESRKKAADAVLAKDAALQEKLAR